MVETAIEEAVRGDAVEDLEQLLRRQRLGPDERCAMLARWKRESVLSLYPAARNLEVFGADRAKHRAEPGLLYRLDARMSEYWYDSDHEDAGGHLHSMLPIHPASNHTIS